MNLSRSEWNRYERLDFSFEGRDAIVILPKNPRKDCKWLLKTEYFGAFPSFELEMLERGYALAHLKSTTRWCPPEDTDARARFCEFLQSEFGFASQCMPVGMSCGGMQAVYLAAKYPHLVAALYLDAPVLNLLSCPCGVGVASNKLYAEFEKAMGMTASDLINYRNHPIDHVEELLSANLPVMLVCGDSDGVVPYSENGKHLADAYRRAGGICEVILKAGCDHHPHGLDDNAPLLAFAEKYYN